MKNIAYLFAVILVCVPFGVHAETVLRIGEDVSVDADQTVNGDYYVTVGPFNTTAMSGTIAEDMYAFGGSVLTNGTVGSDLTIVGGTAQVYGAVADDVRIVAGEVTISEHVGGDLFVVAGSLHVLSSASIDGDLIFFGGDAEINGKVGGSVLGSSEKMRIDSEVGGDVDIKTATELTLGGKANVAGTVSYTSLSPVVRAQNATIAGEVIQNQYVAADSDVQSKTRKAFIPVFVTLFAALSLYLLFRSELQVLVDQIQKAPFKNMLFGVAVLVLGPIVSLLLIATVLGILVGVLSLSLVLIAYVIGFALSGVVLGAYFSKLFTRKMTVSLPWILLGTLTFHALFFIPVIGSVVVLLVFIATVGGLATSLYKLLS